MNRAEILVKVHQHIDDFFRPKWSEFCRRVEDYAERLYELERNAREQYKREWQDKRRKAWRDKQVKQGQEWVEQAQARCREAVDPYNRALKKYRQAYDRFRQAVAQCREEQARKRKAQRILSQPRDEPSIDHLLSWGLPADLSDLEDLRRKVLAYGVEAERLHDAYEVARKEADDLRDQADPEYYQPSSCVEREQRGPQWEWTWPHDDQAWVTAYLWGENEDRTRPRPPLYPAMRTPFWRPVELVNPAAWFFDLVPGAPRGEPSDDDKVLRDSVVLAVAYDRDPPHTMSQQIIPTRQYPGSFFMADQFVGDLWDILRKRGDTAIQGAWRGVEGQLPAAGGDLATQLQIDLQQWSKGRGRNLMQDLVDDDLREGVVIRPGRHGKNQPKELRRSLREVYGLATVADAIQAVKGKKRTFKLTIPRDLIKCKSPKS